MLRTHARSRRTGFTLIELLVVIAIIAILAAILFPVFSQARAKARQTSCLSNFKQVGLSILMYNQDYDETMPPWDNGRVFSDDWQTEFYWPQLVVPYIKNWQIFACPEDGNAHDSFYLQQFRYPANTTGLQLEHARALYTDFGYNFHAMSPIDYSMGIYPIYRGTALAAIGQPSATILGVDSNFSEPYSRSNTQAGINYVWTPEINPWILTGNSPWYGYVAPRHSNQANVAFADGHTKSKTIGALLQGFDPIARVITDPDAYLWDLQ
ncbi:MAG TPA: DUF1559 domain-containing protein [Chthonomonadaceae bacterium]|nr:DUF1559 domain-containing protein [Chthonomonadaceae bacterium]